MQKARIFNFKTEKRRLKLYEEMVEVAGDFLDKTVYDLVNLAVNIAVSAAWDEWDKEQPIGISFDFQLNYFCHALMKMSGNWHGSLSTSNPYPWSIKL